MNHPAFIVLLLLAAYLLGSIPSAVWISRWVYGSDIRSQGSQNAGLTNVYRVLGLKAAVPVAVLDLAKGMSATWLGMALGIANWPPEIAGMAAGVCAVLGHSFTVFAGFRGGKGVLTGLGIFLVLVPLSALLAFLGWLAVLLFSGYVSLASIAAAFLITGFTLMEVVLNEKSIWIFGMTLVLSLFVIIRHRGNIERLRRGTENRFNSWFLLKKEGESS